MIAAETSDNRILALPAHYPIAYAQLSRVEGRKRQIWACVVIESEGDEACYPCRSERDARWMAGVFLKRFADKRALESDPLVAQLLALPKEAQRRIGLWLVERAKDDG